MLSLCVDGDNFGDCIYAEAQAKRVKYAYDKGHQVASHTWAHKNLTSLTWDQGTSSFFLERKFVQLLIPSSPSLVHHEMWLAEEAIWKITGAYPAMVRPRTSSPAQAGLSEYLTLTHLFTSSQRMVPTTI